MTGRRGPELPRAILAGATARKGEGEKAKEAKVDDFRAAMAWLMQQCVFHAITDTVPL